MLLNVGVVHGVVVRTMDAPRPDCAARLRNAHCQRVAGWSWVKGWEARIPMQLRPPFLRHRPESDLQQHYGVEYWACLTSETEVQRWRAPDLSTLWNVVFVDRGQIRDQLNDIGHAKVHSDEYTIDVFRVAVCQSSSKWGELCWDPVLVEKSLLMSEPPRSGGGVGSTPPPPPTKTRKSWRLLEWFGLMS